MIATPDPTLGARVMRRQFNDRRGNEHLTLDLEACSAAPDERAELCVVALTGPGFSGGKGPRAASGS